jgi:enamine deaminase RidA (YjgF/YER057c/UK114 family)
MTTPAKLDVASAARIHATDWGDFTRIDLNMLGASLGAEPAGGWVAWSHEQNRRLCDFMATELAKRGGGFDSIAEWTVAVNRHYDLQDMRNVRTGRWSRGFGSAITTLPWANPASTRSVSIQTVAYVPKHAQAPFALKAWQPECLYNCDFLGLAPAVVAEVGSARMIYLSGVVAWDKAIQPLAGDDPRAQVRLVLQKIQEVFVEAGGSPADVVRLRPFTANPAVARLIREECANLWTKQGHPAPVLLMAEESSFWGAPSLFTEIQVMGIVGRAGKSVGQEEGRIAGLADEATRVRRTCTAHWDMVHIGELRAPAGTSEQAEAVAVGRQVSQVLSELALAPADVCLAVAYVSSASVMARLDAVLGDILGTTALHLVFSPAMSELNGRKVKLELTARKLK